ncbi:MAG: hypothetical protein ACR2P1_12685, partial [Pseudomonadales bacterium]
MKTKNQFRDIDDYAQEISRKNSAPAAQVADSNMRAQINKELKQLDEQGFVIIENLLPAEQLSYFRSEILALLGPTGRHGFEGFKTQRIYSLLQKTLLCNPLVEHPHV